MEENKRHFRTIFRQFVTGNPFNPALFPAEPAPAAPCGSNNSSPSTDTMNKEIILQMSNPFDALVRKTQADHFRGVTKLIARAIRTSPQPL